MNSIKYSFIIPHKNSPCYLQRCVNSIPRRDDVQIIIVDDGSDKEIIDWTSFKFDNEKCIELITTQGKNAGFARNVGLSFAKGEWILFADSDDLYVDGFLDVLDDYTDKDIDVLYFNISFVHADSLLPHSYKMAVPQCIENYLHGKSSLDTIKYTISPPWFKMVSSSFLQKYNIKFEEVIIGNDIWFSLQVGYFAQKVLVIPDVLYYYTYNLKSLSNVKRSPIKDVVVLEGYVKRNAFYKFIGHTEWHVNILGMVKEQWLKSHFKIRYIFLMLANIKRIYKIRNKYVDGIKKCLQPC